MILDALYNYGVKSPVNTLYFNYLPEIRNLMEIGKYQKSPKWENESTRPGEGSAFAFIRHFFDIQVLRVEGLEHTIVDCWKCLKYATFSRWNCSTDKRKNQAVPTIYPQ